MVLNCASEGDLDGLKHYVRMAKREDLCAVQNDVDEVSFHVDATDFEGRTAVHYAAFYGNLSCVKYLVEKHGAKVDVRDRIGQTPLFYAAHGCDCHVFTFLLKNGK